MKISEYRNEDALDLLADIIDPVSEIITDPAIQQMVKANNRIKIVSYVLKKHKEPILKVLARIEGVSVSEYDASIMKMTRDLLEILNDKELANFFYSQGQTMGSAPSGSATETTKETAAE